jgi:chromosome segregation ATPase
MVKIKTKRRYIGGTRKTTKRKLMDCLEDKSKLENYLEEFKLSLENTNSEIKLLRKDISDLKKDNTQLNNNIGDLKKDNTQLNNNIGDLKKDNQQLHIEVGDLQANLIIANIVTSIQDINSYKKLIDNKLIKNIGSINRLRKDRNILNHFILDNESITESENKLQFIYEKMQEIKEKRPEIIRELNNQYSRLVTDIMKYLKNIKINYDPTTYTQNKPAYEFWWNRLP